MSGVLTDNVGRSGGLVKAVAAGGETKCNINFVGTGTISINQSKNVASITDNGTGDTTIHWDSDFADANFIWAWSAEENTSGNIVSTYGDDITTAAGSLRWTTRILASAVDMDKVSVIAQGAQ